MMLNILFLLVVVINFIFHIIEDEGQQSICIYDWVNSNDPIVTLEISGELQVRIKKSCNK